MTKDQLHKAAEIDKALFLLTGLKDQLNRVSDGDLATDGCSVLVRYSHNVKDLSLYLRKKDNASVTENMVYGIVNEEMQRCLDAVARRIDREIGKLNSEFEAI